MNILVDLLWANVLGEGWSWSDSSLSKGINIIEGCSVYIWVHSWLNNVGSNLLNHADWVVVISNVSFSEVADLLVVALISNSVLGLREVILSPEVVLLIVVSLSIESGSLIWISKFGWAIGSGLMRNWGNNMDSLDWGSLFACIIISSSLSIESGSLVWICKLGWSI